jgi:hypothetical protein
MNRTVLIAAALAFLAAPALAQTSSSGQNAGGPVGSEARRAGAKPPKAAVVKKAKKTARSGQKAGGPAGDAMSPTGGGRPVPGAVPGAKASPQSAGGVKQ